MNVFGEPFGYLNHTKDLWTMTFLTAITLNNGSFVINIVLFLMVAEKNVIHFFWITFHNNPLVVGR